MEMCLERSRRRSRKVAPSARAERLLSLSLRVPNFLQRLQHFGDKHFSLTTNKMLDCFEIVTTSGVVLWSRSYAPVGSHVINSLINDVFIEEKVVAAGTVADDASASRNPAYKHEKYTLRFTTAKDLGLIFVVRHILPWFATFSWLRVADDSARFRPFTNPYYILHG